MRIKKAWIVAAKDLDEFKKNRYIMATLIGMPAILAISAPISFILPILMGGLIHDPQGLVILIMLLDFTLPFLCMIPGINPSIISSYSFVGEKVNKSMEPLLATPTTDFELLFGKSLAAFLPTMIGTYAAFVADIIIIDLVAYPIFGYLIVPDLAWIVGMLLLAPAICIVSIEANVLISSRMSDVRTAQQVGGLLILPIFLVFFGTLTNIFPLNPINMLILSVIVLGIDFVLGTTAIKVFQREEILTKWK